MLRFRLAFFELNAPMLEKYQQYGNFFTRVTTPSLSTHKMHRHSSMDKSMRSWKPWV